MMGLWSNNSEIARHRHLCTSVPFPKLNWSKSERERSLQELYEYAELLAQSVIDWYIRKRCSKKLWSRSFHILSYTFAVFGVLVPLLTVFSPRIEAQLLKPLLGDRMDDANVLSGLSAEAALALIGVAAGFNLIDRFAGFSKDWMRYISTAMRIDAELIEFRFRWSDLDAAVSRANPAAPECSGETPSPKTTAAALVTESKPNEIPCPTEENATPASNAPGGQCDTNAKTPEEQQIELVRGFCLQVVKIVSDETSTWTREFTTSISEFTQHLPGALGRPGGR